MNPIKPTLITTFISTEALTPLIEHLARPKIEQGLALDQDQKEPSEWKNEDESFFALMLEHQELPDVKLMQLVINGAGEASEAWQQLKRARRGLPEEREEARLGMTLIYQAVLPPHADPDESQFALFMILLLLTSKLYLYTRALASRHVSGGKRWLRK